MVEVGKVYSIGVNVSYDVLNHKYIPNSVINVECWHKSEGHFHFRPVEYNGSAPEGRTQAMDTFIVPVSEVDKFAFREEPAE
ncbi:hypothetical protein G6M12_07010 [Agrobacterium tumefaciens]|nr:hypothetical protein [Agrobacterium tumefaciens]